MTSEQVHYIAMFEDDANLRRRAESNGVIRIAGARAGPQCRARALIVRISVAVRAVRLEVGVSGVATARARRRGVVLPTAACRGVGRVGIHVAGRLAPDGEARAVVRALERAGTVRAQVDRAVRDGATDVIRDRDGQVVPVDEGDIVVVVSTRAQSELGKSSRRDAGAGGRIADQPAVAPAVQAGVGRSRAVEGAVPTGPDTARGPVVGNGEADRGIRSGLPSRGVRGRVCRVLSEHGGPDGERAAVVDREGALSQGRPSEGKSERGGYEELHGY